MQSTTTEKIPVHFNGSTLVLHYSPMCGQRRGNLTLATLTEEAAAQALAGGAVRICRKCQ
jgi:hypothetical protein